MKNWGWLVVAAVVGWLWLRGRGVSASAPLPGVKPTTGITLRPTVDAGASAVGGYDPNVALSVANRLRAVNGIPVDRAGNLIPQKPFTLADFSPAGSAYNNDWPAFLPTGFNTWQDVGVAPSEYVAAGLIPDFVADPAHPGMLTILGDVFDKSGKDLGAAINLWNGGVFAKTGIPATEVYEARKYVNVNYDPAYIQSQNNWGNFVNY